MARLRYTNGLKLVRGRRMLLANPRADLSNHSPWAVVSVYALSCVWNGSTLCGHGGIVLGQNPYPYTAKHVINCRTSWPLDEECS